MKYKRSVMVMILIWLDYLVHSLSNYAMTLPIKTALVRLLLILPVAMQGTNLVKNKNSTFPTVQPTSARA